MSENTITIPADLWFPEMWSAQSVRNAGNRLRNEGYSCEGRVFLRLADEMERQAPRKVGWYSWRHNYPSRFLYYWDGNVWRYSERGTALESQSEKGAIIEPVTIGASS